MGESGGSGGSRIDGTRPDPLRGGRWSRADTILAATGAAMTFAMTWPFRARFLTEWDSGLFALALEDYDFLAGHPHPPGYPVFVVAARMARFVWTDANEALVIVSLAFGAAAVALLYGLLREFVGAAVAAPAAFLFALSPTLAFNRAVALSYTAEAAFAIGVAWLAWRTHRSPTLGRVAVTAGVFGFGLGFRQSMAFFLAPLVAWGVLGPPWNGRSLARRVGAASAAGSAAVLAWLIPMILAGGGLGAWWATSGLQTRMVVFERTVFNSGWAAVVDHGGRLVYFLTAESGLFLWGGASVIVLALAARPDGRWLMERFRGHHRVLSWLAAWTLPSVLFYTFVFSGWDKGPRGYVLVFLPALYVAFALTVTELLERARTRRPSSGVWRAAPAIAVAAILLPGPVLAAEGSELLDRQVWEHDAWSRSWLGLRDEFPAGSTAIVTSHSWIFAKWYFPEYTVWGHRYIPNGDGTAWRLMMESRDHRDDVPFYGAHLEGRGAASHPIPDGIRTVIVFDFQLAGENDGVRLLAEDVEVREHFLADGWRILYFEVEGDRPTIEDYFAPEPG